MYYFAYGSNMSTRRLQQRVPSACVVGPGTLSEHRLQFHKVGRDGSAKCDAARSRRGGEVLPGVIYRIDPAHKPRLDAAEGLGHGYAQKQVQVRLPDASEISAFTYYATHIDPTLKPFDWYKEHVVRGAREHGLPALHIAAIAATIALADSDPLRHASELAIYR